MALLSPPPEAFIFDFGRVISSWKPPSLFAAYEQELGLVPGTINTIMFTAKEWQEALVGQRSMESFWRAIGPRLRLHNTERLLAFKERYYRDERRNEEVIALIDALSSHHRLAILSNHPPGLHQWLERWHLSGYFEVIVVSGDEGVAKPDPAAFRLTLDRLRLPAARCLFIDDTPGHVAAAAALGLPGLVFTDAKRLREELTRRGVTLKAPNGQRKLPADNTHGSCR